MNKFGWVLVVVGTAAQAQECEPEVQPVVRVHLENIMAVPPAILARARGVAADLFADIGVRLEWKEGAPRPSTKPKGCKTANEVIEVQFDEAAPARFQKEALGYAVPGKGGICVHIFYTHVAAAHARDLTPVLLGHVLTHEITHVLQGVARHSSEGLMKAHWSSDDYVQMSTHSLPFADENVQLVRAHFAGSKQ